MQPNEFSLLSIDCISCRLSYNTAIHCHKKLFLGQFSFPRHPIFSTQFSRTKIVINNTFLNVLRSWSFLIYNLLHRILIILFLLDLSFAWQKSILPLFQILIRYEFVDFHPLDDMNFATSNVQFIHFTEIYPNTGENAQYMKIAIT